MNKTFHILILEDSLEDGMTYERYLKQEFGDHITIKIIDKGKPALAYLSENAVDCILIDFQLPDMTGLDFVEEIKNKSIAFIMITGEGNETIAVKALTSGAHDYIIKNELTSKALCRTIIQIFEKNELSKKIKLQEEKINYLAYHDALTNVPNRTVFEKHLSDVLSKAIRSNRSFAILFVDVDHFKKINDTFGHQYGDLVLKQLVKRLAENLRASDLLARLGGDEFAIVLDDIKSTTHAGSAAQKIVDVMKRPFSIEGSNIVVTLSIGIAVYPDAGDNMVALIRHADMALYKAKELGRNRFNYFTEALNKEAKKHMSIENHLRTGLTNDNFCLFYQPIFNLNSDAVYGVGALLRSKHPDLTDVSTEEIIFVAEESKLIFQLGEWVLETAFENYNTWVGMDCKQELKLSINLSSLQLNQENFIEQFKALLSSYNISAEKIILEISETSVLSGTEKMRQQFLALSQMGCAIFLDDFGVKYSSFNLLKELPISGLKIDKSIIQDVNSDPTTKILVESIFQIGEKLNLTVISEGVETKQQLDFIRSCASQKAQGFYLAKPMPESMVVDFVNNKSAT